MRAAFYQKFNVFQLPATRKKIKCQARSAQCEVDTHHLVMLLLFLNTPIAPNLKKMLASGENALVDTRPNGCWKFSFAITGKNTF